MSAHTPYLSVVVTSRNDNHGGTLLRRMQIFTDCLIAQCKRHDLSAELIVVEWNPPLDRPPLASALRWPADSGPCAVRFITVPPEIHQRYRHGVHLPLYQMIAKNVGIRRARGEFILATNIDVILNDELAAFIAQRNLQRGTMYRIDRTDADALVPDDAPLDEVLAYCQAHVLRVNARKGTFPIGPHGMRALAPVDVADHEAVVSLGLGWYEPEREPDGSPCRWVDNDAEIWLRGPAQADDAPLYMSLDIQPGPAAGNGPFLLRAIHSDGAVPLHRRIFTRQRVTFPIRLQSGGLQRIILHADPFLPRSTAATLDPRRLSFMVRRIDLSTSPPPDADAAPRDCDIASDPIVLGEGWFPLESAYGRPFRWLDTDADIWIEGNQHPFLEIELEPGPSLERSPLLLHVERSGADPVALPVIGRRKVSIPLPPQTACDLTRLTLRVDSPRQVVPGDARILNVQVHSLRLVDQPADPAPPACEVPTTGGQSAFGPGWHLPEQLEDHWFRWADNDARIWIASDASADHPRYALLRISPGPSLGDTPAELTAAAATGQIVARLESTSGILRLPLDGPLCRFTLHVDSPALAVPADARLLNFRLDEVTVQDDAAPLPARSAKPARPSAPSVDAAPPPSLPAYLHTNACGDFTLLHRDHWFDLRGYAEWDVFSLNIDSLFCFTAHHGGAPERVLHEPMRLYHIEHNVGSGWTPEGQQLLINRIRELGIPDVHWTEVAHLAALMNKYNEPILFCRENWGLHNEDLPETAISAAPPESPVE